MYVIRRAKSERDESAQQECYLNDHRYTPLHSTLLNATTLLFEEGVKII